jgi:hypothetical protein
MLHSPWHFERSLCTTMKFHLLCFLSVYALNAQAFTTSGRRASSLRSVSDRCPLLVRYSTATSGRKKKSWNDLHQFNIELDRLAEQSGNFNQPVISKASTCEELWEAQLKDTDGNIRPDTVSFNTVLKAWNRCGNALSESTRNHKKMLNDSKHTTDVYTTRDAAKRATTLLLKQEKDETVKPDETSYNIVIGKN